MTFEEWWADKAPLWSSVSSHEMARYSWEAALQSQLAWKYGDTERRKDNWTLIRDEETKNIGKMFKDRQGREVQFFGIVDGYDDYYYGMYSEEAGLMLLSCVGSIEGHGYEEIPSKSFYDQERERYEARIAERGISSHAQEKT